MSNNKKKKLWGKSLQVTWFGKKKSNLPLKKLTEYDGGGKFQHLSYSGAFRPIKKIQRAKGYKYHNLKVKKQGKITPRGIFAPKNYKKKKPTI